MKSILLTILTFASLYSYSQSSAVTWKIKCVQVDHDIYELQIGANIHDDWLLYSQDSIGDILKLSTQIRFEEKDGIEFIDGTEEMGKKTSLYNSPKKAGYYEKEVIFIQVFKLKDKDIKGVSGEVSYVPVPKKGFATNRVKFIFYVPIKKEVFWCKQ